MINVLPKSTPPAKPLSTGQFRRIGVRGIGDPFNSYPHSCAWFNGQLYIGMTRNTMQLWATKDRGRHEMGLDPYPVPKVPIRELDLRGQIWRYTPDTKEWDLAYRAPLIEWGKGPVEVTVSAAHLEKTAPLALSFRNMVVFQGKSDPAPALYTIPTQGQRPPRRIMFRSLDGDHFEEIPQPLVPGETEGMWRSFRGLVNFKGRLYTSPAGRQDIFATINKQYKAQARAANIAHGSCVRCTDDPARGQWELSSLPDLGDSTNYNIFDLGVCGDYLYAGTLNVREGYQVWRTDGEGPCPHRWEKVLDLGADRGPLNQGVACFAEFQGNLYVGSCIQNGGFDKQNNIGPAGAEIIRICPDGTWDLVIGDPRNTRQGFKIPTSGLDAGFGTPLNGYIWRMCVHEGVLYAGTAKLAALLPYSNHSKWPTFAQRVLYPDALERLLDLRGGAELWRTSDGDNWVPVTLNGFNNRFNGGIRSLLSTPVGIFAGTQNPFGPQIAIPTPLGWRYEDNPRGGVEVWHGCSEHVGGIEEDRSVQEVVRLSSQSQEFAADLATEKDDVSDPQPPRHLTEDAICAEAWDIASEAALCNPELVDPLGRMALVEPDLEVSCKSAADEVSRFYQGSALRNVGYWRAQIHGPLDAARSLIQELTSGAFTDRSTEQKLSVLVIGPNAGPIAKELRKLRPESSLATLAFDRGSANQNRTHAPFAKVLRTRRRKWELPPATYDLVLLVEESDVLTNVERMTQIRRSLKPNGVLAAAELVVQPTESHSDRASFLDQYEGQIRYAGFEHFKVLDTTPQTWQPFYKHSRDYFRSMVLVGQLSNNDYQQTLLALPGGDQEVVAYLLVFATQSQEVSTW